MAGLIDHLERFLGPIELGWTHDADNVEMPFQVVRFGQGSGPGTVSFSTLGLSRYGLPSSTSGREIRHELLMIMPDSLRDGPVPSLLHQVGMDVLTTERPLLRGDVIGPKGPLVPGSSMEALYVGIPVYFPDEFGACQEDGHSVVIAWLIPISAQEAAYVGRQGWEAFEDRLVEADPDLTDVYRASLPFDGDCHNDHE